MHELLEIKLRRVCTLSQFLDGILEAFEETRRLNTENSRIGYVSGIVSSDGPTHIEENLEVLQVYTKTVSSCFNIPAFCVGDIFTYNTLEFFESQKIQHQDLVSFWHKVLSLNYITDVFMTPDWTRSRGATEEHKSAERLKLTIHYLPKEFIKTNKDTFKSLDQLPKIPIQK